MSIKKIQIPIEKEMMEIVPAFINNRKGDVEQIDSALQQKDFVTIQRLGHDMKGVGSGYGFHEVTLIGQALEKAAKDQDSEVACKLLDALKDYLGRIEIVPADDRQQKAA